MKLGLIYATSSVLKDLTVNHCDEAHDACEPHLPTDMKRANKASNSHVEPKGRLEQSPVSPEV